MSQIELQPGFDFQKAGKEVLEIEREGLAQLDQYINQDFSLACEKMFYCAGKVVVMGMGKSGHIGRKMAATFASTGTSSFFVHPGEAAHGDLGMVTPQDIVIALSNSGESNEILALIPVLKRLHNTAFRVHHYNPSAHNDRRNLFLSFHWYCSGYMFSSRCWFRLNSLPKQKWRTFQSLPLFLFLRPRPQSLLLRCPTV